MTADLTPVPGPMPAMGGAFDPAGLGYAGQEFLLSGTATSHAMAGDRTPDGKWEVTAAAQAPFTTRLIVRRPADDADFSGTVVVEWLNVSGGADAAPDWMQAHTELIRAGHAWAGVSAQRAGIEGGGLVDGPHLKKAHPDRYAALSHPGDAWSFDIFSQAGQALLAAPGLLPAAPGGQPPRLLACGQSQSAAFLVTYVNAIDPLARVYDGFLVHGRGATGASLDAGFRRGTMSAGGEQIRADLRVPVLVLQSETDVALLGGGRAAQPDAPLLRNWELAGAAHADTYLLVATSRDDGRMPPAELARLLAPTADLMFFQLKKPVNSGPQHHYVACAALSWLDRWAGGEAVPPAAPRLDLAADGADLARDELGIATGGIRTPWTDVPAAVLSGLGQEGERFATLFGTTAPLPAGRLAALYPGGAADYLARFERSLDGAITAGFLLAADRAEILAVAAAAWPGA
jgi:Alpha/beta hydrolase domain